MDTPFDRIVDSLDPPMYVVTATDGEQRSGCLVGFASQCSIDPPRFMVWISKMNHTHKVTQKASAVTIHALRASDIGTAQHFGELTGDNVDKFKDVGWTAGPEGNPVVDGVDWFAGSILQRVDCGDHVGLLVEPSSGACEHAGEPGLTLRDVERLEPGHPA